MISTLKIKQMGYEASVQREIAVLRKMEHPSVARLVASFRWRDGAYLVLEYAAKGDLFTQIASQGVVDEECARFWLGEVAEALRHVHRLGFVYGDLKPENILLTGEARALALPAQAQQELLARCEAVGFRGARARFHMKGLHPRFFFELKAAKDKHAKRRGPIDEREHAAA